MLPVEALEDGTATRHPSRKAMRLRIRSGPPDEGSFTCPSGQDLSDLTNGVSIVPTGTFSRNFLSIPGSCPN